MTNTNLAICETLYYLTTKIHSAPRGILFLYPKQRLEDGLEQHLTYTEFELTTNQIEKVFRSCYFHLTRAQSYIEFSPDSTDFLKLPKPPSGFYNTIAPNGNWLPEHPVHNPPKNNKGEWPTLSMRVKPEYYLTPLPNHLDQIRKTLEGYNVF